MLNIPQGPQPLGGFTPGQQPIPQPGFTPGQQGMPQPGFTPPTPSMPQAGFTVGQKPGPLGGFTPAPQGPPQDLMLKQGSDPIEDLEAERADAYNQMEQVELAMELLRKKYEGSEDEMAGFEEHEELRREAHTWRQYIEGLEDKLQDLDMGQY